MNNDLLVQVLDTVIDGNLLFILGISSGLIAEKLFPKFNQEEYNKKQIHELYLEIFLYISYITINSIFIKKIITNIYTPVSLLNSDFNYKNVSGGIILAFSLLFFQSNLKEKIKYFHKRIMK